MLSTHNKWIALSVGVSLSFVFLSYPTRHTPFLDTKEDGSVDRRADEEQERRGQQAALERQQDIEKRLRQVTLAARRLQTEA